MIGLLSSLLLGAHADVGSRARAGYVIQNAKTYSGGTTNFGAGYRTPSHFDLGLNVDLLERNYKGGGTVRDDQFTLAGSRPLTATTYLDTTVSASSTANIYARWSAGLAPHFVHEKTDFGLGLRYAQYRLTNVGVYNPTVFHYFDHGFAAGAGANVVRTEQYIVSASAQILFAPGEHHALRLGGGAGRTLEDAGLTARFNALSLEYGYTFSSRFTLGVGLTDYWSQVRRERAVALRLGWR